MDPFNFNELPEIISLLFEKVESIEQLVIGLKPSDTGDNDLLNVEEAAAFLKISEASLYIKVSRKEIPFSKPGKRLYFSRLELQEWISNSRHKTANEISSQLNKSKRKFGSKFI
ncbi:helix-turn-helix domain-containing protein [Mucilaginibacter sp. UR6-1]|uniref:helix-turn-helix domain-containing protein n=1 Tax=Mucilaginibacter sp. UR6-1 TaxID=1435643 RepID=UPI001E3A8EC3|nr:helix-turn-helix domain-containing protein [Mucilaginibacter sp. UR6-1]MCC8407673.1 helix-turn-helix domain-containing protein [Mucilaginibacter sp. UR6-1]